MKTKKVVVTMVAMAFLANVAMAGLNVYFTDADPTDSLWQTAGNWDLGVPAAGDNARINGTVEINADTTAVCYYLVTAQTAAGSVSMTGGTLNAGYQLLMGQAGDTTFAMTGGTVNIAHNTIIGKSNYNSTLQIDGGDFTTRYILVGQATTDDKAKLNLFGGTLTVMLDSQPNLILTEGKGKMEMRGDAVLKCYGSTMGGYLQDRIGLGLLYAGEAGKELLVTDYETYATVTVVPEPATLAMLGIGSVLMLRRKK